MGYGLTSIAGMIGSILSPYIILFSKDLGVNNWIPPALIGFLGWAFSFCLPETFGKSLKDDIEERML